MIFALFKCGIFLQSQVFFDLLIGGNIYCTPMMSASVANSWFCFPGPQGFLMCIYDRGTFSLVNTAHVLSLK